MPGSTLSSISSDAQSYKSASDAQSYKSALGEDADESTLAASPAASSTIVDRASLGRSIVDAVLSDLLEAAMNTSTHPLVAEAPTRSSRPKFPRKAKTCRKALYQDPVNPYARF